MLHIHSPQLFVFHKPVYLYWERISDFWLNLLLFLLLAGNDMGDFREYDPNLLDDPQWPCGKHKRVLIFPSYMVRKYLCVTHHNQQQQ